jgi:hypothetical protein
MTIAKGIFRTVTYKKELVFGVKPVAAGAQELRRTEFDLNLTKETFSSNQIVGHQQQVDFRHGAEKVDGTLQDEVSGLTHKDLWAALLRGTWVPGELGDTPGTLTVPQTGHTSDSFSIESWRSDIAQSEVFTGNRITQAQVQLPANGMATVSFTVMGKSMETAGAQYFTAPTAATTTPTEAGVSGELLIDGVAVATVTAADFTVNGNGSVGAVIGSKSTPDVFVGRIDVSGNFSVYHQDATLLRKFLDEAELSLKITLTEGGDSTDFIAFEFPRLKLGSYTVKDAAGEAIAQCSFTALMDGTGATPADKSVIKITDSRIAA